MAPAITSAEIKEIRTRYGLSQKSFALLLGIGPASMVRYEQGVVPSKANANLIRAARIPEFMAECLQNDGDSIPEKQRKQAESVVYAIAHIDTETGEIAFTDQTPVSEPRYSMDEMYHYTLQQEILNEQAANLIADIIVLKRNAEAAGEGFELLDALLHRISRIKPTITTSEMLDDEKLSSVRGYLNCASDLVARQKAKIIA